MATGEVPDLSGAETSHSGVLDYAAVVERLADAVIVADSAGTVVVANAAAARLFGAPMELMVGRPLTALIPDRFRQAHTAAFRRFADGNPARSGSTPLRMTALRQDGSEIDVDLTLGAVRAADGSATAVIGTLRDVSTEVREQAERLESAQRSQAFLLRAFDVVTQSMSYAETLERLASVAVPTLGDLCLIDVLDATGRLVRMVARHADPARQPLADELRDKYAPQTEGAHPSIAAARTGTSRWSPEMSDEFLRATTYDEHHYDLVKALGFTSYICVPLIADTAVLGIVTLVSAGSGRRFGPADLALAEEVAGRVVRVVAKARLYDTEHRAASILQSSLLPASLPDVDGIQVAVRYLPGTRDMEVGGDFYDVVKTPGSVTFIVGDVAGHDMAAAATMGQLRSACRAFVGQSAGPADLLQLLQHAWPTLGFDRIATAVVGCLDVTDGTLRVASAGHPPPLLLDDGGARLLPVEPGSPLGAPGGSPPQWLGILPAGGTLLFYTDGLVEHRLQDIDIGTSALVAAALSSRATDPEMLCDSVLDNMAGDDRSDDVALLALTRDRRPAQDGRV